MAADDHARRLTLVDAVCLVVSSLLGCATRLWNLHLPATPVYDETHVGRFLNWYHDRAFFFDLHGPLSKLLIYWTATALGFEGRKSCPYESTQPYAADCSLAPQRLVPALCGACMVPLTFATCRAMRLAPLAALLCTWLGLVDTLFISLSRVHMNDMVQTLFIALTHLLALRACAPPSSAWWLAATGTALGCALQCKFAMALTTTAWLGLMNLLVLAEVAYSEASAGLRAAFKRVLKEALMRGLLLLGIPILIHLALLRVHLSYLPNSGNGDNYMTAEFQSTLIGNKHYDAAQDDHKRPSFALVAIEHLRTQFWYNRNMAVLFPRGSHPFDTPWYTWPVAMRGVYASLVKDWYKIAEAVDEKHSFGVYLHPTPHIVLLTTASIAIALIALALLTLRAKFAWMTRRWSSESGKARADAVLSDWVGSLRPGGSGSLAIAYLLHLLPYATQERQTFLLYYLPAYYFAVLAFGKLWHECACVHLRPTVCLIATIALCGAIGRVAWYLSPIAYGSKVLVQEWNDRLRYASTECWPYSFPQEPCWVDVDQKE